MIKRLLGFAVLLFFTTSISFVLLYRVVGVPFTPLMLIRFVEQVGRGESVRFKHQWVSIDEMSKYLPVAVIASEDQLFLSHHGFDLDAINSAAKERISGKRKRGGSTISQQTAKNVFLWPASSWLRKGFEVWFTVLIEMCWNKSRIMEVYLNTIEMGDGVYGAEAVAQKHFHCSAKDLTRAQCALIAATLPNPLRFNSAKPSRYVLRRQTAIMKQMKHIPLLEAKD